MNPINSGDDDDDTLAVVFVEESEIDFRFYLIDVVISTRKYVGPNWRILYCTSRIRTHKYDLKAVILASYRTTEYSVVSSVRLLVHFLIFFSTNSTVLIASYHHHGWSKNKN
jgi:hypothetical protein